MGAGEFQDYGARVFGQVPEPVEVLRRCQTAEPALLQAILDLTQRAQRVTEELHDEG
jgi:hypothetical protein